MTGHLPKLARALSLAAAASLAGCAQQGSLLSRGPTLGTLKTSVSHLEFENGQLKREVAKLKTETRQTEDRLVQEEQVNGELSSRLDDARNLLSERGHDTGSSRLDPEFNDESPKRTLPAGNSNRKRRKPPFAQIPGRIDDVPALEPRRENPDDLFGPATPGREGPGPQGRRDETDRWLPVAQGIGETPPKRVR